MDSNFHANCLRRVKVGDTAPDFRLPNGEGNMIESETLRHQGPLVILFYRGKW
jgi:peroxiredoxin